MLARNHALWLVGLFVCCNQTTLRTVHTIAMVDWTSLILKTLLLNAFVCMDLSNETASGTGSTLSQDIFFQQTLCATRASQNSNAQQQ